MRELHVRTGPRGLRLCLCAWGPDEGVPVLVLHGFLEQGAAWDAVARGLERRVVAPDQRGHGRSEHVGAGGFYHFWDYVADVDGLVRHLGGPIDLAGHSMGGTVAALFAATRPEAVRRLVLVEGLGPPDAGAALLDRPVAFLDHLARPRRHPTFASVEEAAARMLAWNPGIPGDVARALAARATRPVTPDDPHVEGAAPGRLTWTWDPLHRGRSPAPFRADVHRAFLARVRAPTLLVDGGRSTLVLEDREARAAALPDARTVVIADAGHLVHHDAPGALAATLRRFLGD